MTYVHTEKEKLSVCVGKCCGECFYKGKSCIYSTIRKEYSSAQHPNCFCFSVMKWLSDRLISHHC